MVISRRERKEIGMRLCDICNYLFLKQKNNKQDRELSLCMLACFVLIMIPKYLLWSSEHNISKSLIISKYIVKVNIIFSLVLGELHLNILSHREALERPNSFKAWLKFSVCKTRETSLIKSNKVSEEQLHIKFIFDSSLAQLEWAVLKFKYGF